MRRGRRVVTVCLNLQSQISTDTPQAFELRFQGLGVATGIHLQLYYRQFELERARLTAESANACQLMHSTSVGVESKLG